MALTHAWADPPGHEGQNPQRVGNYAVMVKDLTVTSDGANDTGVTTITAAECGLAKITGATLLGVNVNDSDTDEVGYASFDIALDGDDMEMTPKTVAGAALDVDATDHYSVRLQIWGL